MRSQRPVQIALFVIVSLAAAGCGVPEVSSQASDIFDELNPALLNERETGGEERIPRQRVRTGRVSDGSSNAIPVGEAGAAEPGAAAPDEETGGDAQPDSDPAQPPDAPAPDVVSPEAPETDEAPETPADSDALLAEATALLNDKFFEFGTSQFFSGGSITENVELQTCAFGRFGMRITRVTSTSLDTFSSESLLFGTWSVRSEGGAAILVLNVEEASDPNDVGLRELGVTADAAGNVFFDGTQAQAADAAADCAAAPRAQP